MPIIQFSLTFFALQMCWYAVRYLVFGNEGVPLPFEDRYLEYRSIVVIHGFAGMVALLGGGLQFALKGPRHRWLGRVYLLGVLVAAATGVPMALRAEGGWPAQLSFLLLDLAWLVTAALAWRTAVTRRFAAHRRWMERNYALTYSAVILRLVLNGLEAAGFGFNLIYPVASWSWVSTLACAELVARERR